MHGGGWYSGYLYYYIKERQEFFNSFPYNPFYINFYFYNSFVLHFYILFSSKANLNIVFYSQHQSTAKESIRKITKIKAKANHRSEQVKARDY